MSLIQTDRFSGFPNMTQNTLPTPEEPIQSGFKVPTFSKSGRLLKVAIEEYYSRF